MTPEEIYRIRYRKDDLAESYYFRTTFINAKACASKQINLNVNLEKNDLVFNENSLQSFIQLNESNLYFTSEALIKTYPTKYLTDAVVKYLVDNCIDGIDSICLYSPSLDSTKRLNELFVYNGEDKKTYCFDIDNDSFDNYNINMKCIAAYVENDVAGRIKYVFSINSLKNISFKNNDIEQLIHIGNRYGYDYVAYSFIASTATLYLDYEAKYQLNDIVISNYLYHVAPKSIQNKILKYGLCPKSKSFINGNSLSHSNRIYVFNGYNEDTIKSFIYQCGKKSLQYNKLLHQLAQTNDFVVFKIDKSKIKNLQLYRDNNFQSMDAHHPTALYTYTNIPSTSIIDVTSLKL